MSALHLPIAEPCHADWEAMEPRQQGRFCQGCAKDVHDLGAMTEAEARALLRSRAGQRLCVRYGVGIDGRIRFKAAAAVALAGALAACTPHEQPGSAATRAGPTAAAAPTPVTPDVDPAEPSMPVMGSMPVPVMGEVPPIEVAPKPTPMPSGILGAITAPSPPVQHVRGEIAVANEPCDPPPAADAFPRFHDGMR
jgi:hypothetical protein